MDQSTISRYSTFLTPLIGKGAGFRPSAEEAADTARGAIALVDGTLWPCWSWAGERELWAGKYKTTGHGSLIITNLAGEITFVSEPVPGNQHDMAKLKDSECATVLKAAAMSSAIRDSSGLITSSPQCASRTTVSCTCAPPWNAPLPA